MQYSTILTERLTYFVRNSEEFVQVYGKLSDDEIAELFRSGELSITDHIKWYKAERWASFSRPRLGNGIASGKKQINRIYSRNTVRMLVAEGWIPPTFNGEEVEADTCCAYCLIPLSYGEMEIEHAVPKSRGGSDELSNLVPSCYECNREKSDRTPAEYWESKGYPNDLKEMMQSMMDGAIQSRIGHVPYFPAIISKHKAEQLGILSSIEAN